MLTTQNAAQRQKPEMNNLSCACLIELILWA